MTNINWVELENRVRSIASYRWFRPARPETINGVRVDCVVKTEPDHWVLVEISKSTTLTKLRTDLAKFATVRPYLFSQDVYCKCYFVCAEEPTESLITAGAGQHVQVLSAEHFSKELVNHEVYSHARNARPFGSSVNPFTGEPDDTEYIPVEYITADSKQRFSIDEIANRLAAGKHFVLMGQYGSGKSRCLRQVFHAMSLNAQQRCIFPFAIDLRRHWGAKRGEEIVRRHFEELGMSDYTDAVLRAFVQGGVVFLLDGFDEIGSQAWSDRTQDLRAIRREAVVAVRDLIQANRSGVLITGRQHFFDSNNEMLDALGIDQQKATTIYASDEFTPEQMDKYLQQRAPKTEVPVWLPRRPLICQVIASLEEEELNRLLQHQESEVPFWRVFIRVLCERESRIHHALHADGIHAILKRLARITRSKIQNFGPVSLTEINQVFAELAGTLPVEESTAMLQRLPGMGRLSAETSDRQFVDAYILNGLRADDLVDSLRSQPVQIDVIFMHPLDDFGQSIVTAEMATTEESDKAVHLARVNSDGNPTLSTDLVASLARTNLIVDFRGLHVRGGEIGCLDLSGENICNIRLSETIIQQLHLPNHQPTGVEIVSSILGQVYGLNASAQGLPDWILESSVEQIHRLDTLDRIKDANLSPPQQILVTILKKTFFQPGAGRKEESLVRGLGDIAKPSTVRKIINRLLSTGLLKEGKGSSGTVYRPNRSQTERVGKILADLKRSSDELWDYATSLEK